MLMGTSSSFLDALWGLNCFGNTKSKGMLSLSSNHILVYQARIVPVYVNISIPKKMFNLREKKRSYIFWSAFVMFLFRCLNVSVY
jgi:hypothetical protein